MREAAQYELMLASKAQGDSCVSFIAEGESHHLYEIRVHKIHHRGDVSIDSGLEIDAVGAEEDEDLEPGAEERKWGGPADQSTLKRVRFDDEAGAEQASESFARKEIRHFFGKFQALNFYYQQVNKQHGGGVAPSFYRFKLSPLSGPVLNRVYEVEEHVGRCFIDEAAEMHLAHQRAMQHAKRAKSTLGWQAS